MTDREKIIRCKPKKNSRRKRKNEIIYRSEHRQAF